MASDVGEYEKWLVFNESYLELIPFDTISRFKTFHQVTSTLRLLQFWYIKNWNVEHIYGHVVNQNLILLWVSKSARDHILCTCSNECYSYTI